MCATHCVVLCLFCDRFLSIARWLDLSLVHSLARSFCCIVDSHICHPIPVQFSPVHFTAHMCHHIVCGLLCTSSMVSITFPIWKHARYSHGQSAAVVWQSAHTVCYELIISVTSRRAMICQILANLYSLSYDTMNTRSHARTHIPSHIGDDVCSHNCVLCSHYDIIHRDCVTNLVSVYMCYFWTPIYINK